MMVRVSFEPKLSDLEDYPNSTIPHAMTRILDAVCDVQATGRNSYSMQIK